MRSLLVVTWLLSISPGQTPGTAIDASAVKVGAPQTVAELDLGTLKSELRQVGWSRDGAELYVQTADGSPTSETLRHYLVPAAGGTVKPIDKEPEWATGAEDPSQEIHAGMGDGQYEGLRAEG